MAETKAKRGQGPGLLGGGGSGDKYKPGGGNPFEGPERSLPFSDDAEKGVLSCMLQAPNPYIGRAIEELGPELFYVPANQLLYERMLGLQDGGKPVEPISLTQTLSDNNELEAVGGPAAVTELYGFVPSPGHFDFYADIVREKFTLRSIITTCSDSIQRAYEGGDEVAGILDEVESRVLAIRDSQADDAQKLLLTENLMDAIDTIEKMITDPDSMKGTATGFKGLDTLTNGLHGGEMIVIAARPSMGKTSIVMNMIEHVGVDLNIPCAVFSLEMPTKQLVMRLLCSRAQLSMRDLQGGLLTKEDQGRLTRAAAEMNQSTIVIDDTPALSILELRAKARRFKQDHGIGLIAIDYLQLLKSTSKKAQDSRQIEIAEISGGIKALAKELDLPIIVLAQLNRNVEQRSGGRPMLSDLRESGSIEQDADLVGLLTRSNYAGSKQGDPEEDGEEDEDNGESLLIVAKHRNGPTGDVPLTFLDFCMRFVDREVPQEEPL